MKPAPDGWPRISVELVYDDAKAAIDWLCKAFGFEVRLLVETGDGAVAHSELVFGDGVVMVSQAGSRPYRRSPRAVGGCTQSLGVYVDDLDAHCERARAAGAVIDAEPRVSDYGGDYWSDRSYGAFDCGGHYWWFSQRLQTGNPNWSKVRGKVERSQHET